MAMISIKDYIDIGTGGVHNATSWQIAKDKEFTKIIDQSLKDKVNVKKWYSMLPKLPEDGPGYYADLDELYVRVKIWIDDYTEDWFVLSPGNQNKQKVVITETGKEPVYTDSDSINLQ